MIEITDLHNTDTYRTVYTAQLGPTAYGAARFQKKSKRGISTPQRDIEVIRRRLAEAERLEETRRS